MIDDKMPSSRDIYLRYTDVDGNVYVRDHRVWDAALFLASQEADARKMNADVKGDKPRRASVQQITHDQYLLERK